MADEAQIRQELQRIKLPPNWELVDISDLTNVELRRRHRRRVRRRHQGRPDRAKGQHESDPQNRDEQQAGPLAAVAPGPWTWAVLH